MLFPGSSDRVMIAVNIGRMLGGQVLIMPMFSSTALHTEKSNLVPGRPVSWQRTEDSISTLTGKVSL